MIRLAVTVEGQTEEEFVKDVLAPHLQSCGVAAIPILLGRARNSRVGGGNVTVPELVSEIVHLRRSHDAVTTLVDFYGFRGKEQHSADELEQEIRGGVEESTGWQRERVMPYVQRHEFEGLLFSDVRAFMVLTDLPPQAVHTLGNIRSAFTTPEDINDNRCTAPSRRIAGVVPRYRKKVDGPLIAAEMGLETIRAECPRFSAWLECLESLRDRIGP